MHIYYPDGQFYVLLYFFVIGAGLGAVFDVLKIKREFFGSMKIILFFDDFLYMLFCSLVIVLGVLKVNSGRLRWYELACPAFGFFVYRKTLSKLVICFFFYISRRIKAFLHAVLKLAIVLLKPVYFLFKKILFKCKKYILSKCEMLYMEFLRIKFVNSCKKICN